MDEQTRETFEEFKKAQTALLASYTVANGMLKAHQLFLSQVARKIGLVSAGKVSIEEWIQNTAEKHIRDSLLKCDDEQLSAEIESLLKKPDQEE